MRVYLGQARGSKWPPILDANGFGEMCVRGELPPRRRPWAFDNGAFRDHAARVPFRSELYERDLIRLEAMEERPDFIVVPDMVARGLESLAFSDAWLPRLRHLGAPLYLAVQDGMEEEDVARVIRNYDGVFVGGSAKWKLRTAPSWVRFSHGLNKPCHIGAMGTRARVRAAIRWGADSIDSALPLWADANMERFLSGFRPTGQGVLI